MALAIRLGDEENCGEDQEEAAEGVEEEDVEPPHGLKHGPEEEGDKEPENAADQASQRNNLTPISRRRRRRRWGSGRRRRRVQGKVITSCKTIVGCYQLISLV